MPYSCGGIISFFHQSKSRLTENGKKFVPQWRNSGASLQIVARQRSFTQYRRQGLLTASPEPVPGASSPIALATTESEHATRIIGNGAAAAR